MEAFARAPESRGKGGRRRVLLLACAILALLSSTLLLALRWPRFILLAGHLHAAVLGHPYFSVREVKVSGGEKIGGGEVLRLAGLSEGMSVWEIDPRRIEEKVRSHPWVRRVTVRRELPHRIVIEIEERAARGIAVLGRLYYVDSEGVVFKPVEEGEGVDYPFLTGLEQAGLTSHAASTRQRMQEVLRLADLLGPGLTLSQIHFRPDGGVVLYPTSYAVALHMGWGDWQEKLQRLEQVLAEWRGREKRLAALDLSFRDQVVARLKRDQGMKGLEEGTGV